MMPIATAKRGSDEHPPRGNAKNVPHAVRRMLKWPGGCNRMIQPGKVTMIAPRSVATMVCSYCTTGAWGSL